MVSQSSAAVVRMSPVAIVTTWAVSCVLFGSTSEMVVGTTRSSSASSRSRRGERRTGLGAEVTGMRIGASPGRVPGNPSTLQSDRGADRALEGGIGPVAIMLGRRPRPGRRGDGRGPDRRIVRVGGGTRTLVPADHSHAKRQAVGGQPDEVPGPQLGAGVPPGVEHPGRLGPPPDGP